MNLQSHTNFPVPIVGVPKRNIADYSSFGVALDGRTIESDGYRYGFNCKEKDIEWNKIHYEFREYDSRTARMISIDPRTKEYSWQSSYSYHANSPIKQIDYLGGGAPPKETKFGKFLRDWTPGIIAAPLGGLVDGLTGVGKMISGAVKRDANIIKQGAIDFAGGILSMIGLKELVFSSRTKSPTSTSKVPDEINNEMTEMQRRAWTQLKINPADNGMHAWHSGSNAALSNKLGPVGAVFVWLLGIYHETPFDKKSFQDEQIAQGTINHIIDSFTDIIANTFGMTIGLILPKKPAKWLSLRVGNLIPGPGDPDPNGTGGGGYTGNPTDAWFNWWKNGKTSDNPYFTP